jgi:hypothetical protein
VTLRRLAAVACALVLLAAVVLPGGGPIDALVPDVPGLGSSDSVARAAADAVASSVRAGVLPHHAGRAPPTA